MLSNSAPFTAVLGSIGDSTQVTLALASPALAKSFYAINGNTILPTPLKISPDDAVTYLLRYDMQTGDFRNLTLTDYLPLPMFDATTLTAFVSTTSGIPAAGTAQWAATMSNGDLSHISAPTIQIDANQNAVAFEFGTRSDPGNTPTQIAILFTVKASTRPYVDNLYFTNQVSAQQEAALGLFGSITPSRRSGRQCRNCASARALWAQSDPKASITQTVAGPVPFAAAGTGNCANRFSGVIRSGDWPPPPSTATSSTPMPEILCATRSWSRTPAAGNRVHSMWHCAMSCRQT